MSEAMAPLPKDAPVMVAWETYKQTTEYANTRQWALHEAHVDGSLWAAFLAGFERPRAAIEATTVKGDGLVETDNATPEQVERANAAVEAHLIDGVPRWDSAQGYACALTAIMQADAEAADTITTLKGEIERRDAALKEADDFICKWAHREDENARFVVMSIRQALSQGTDNVG